MRIPHIIANVLGFSLSPVVALSLAMLFDEDLGKYRFKLAIPLYFQAVICILSSWNGWIFSVSITNEYTRGPLFFLNAATSLYTFIIFIYANHQSSKEYDSDERIYLILLYVIVLFGNVTQIIFPNILLIWNCVAISNLLYYIFLRDLGFKYDPLTGARNRFSFQKMMIEMQEIDTVGIVVLDLNNLKGINDTFGHLEGDKFISDSATIIKSSFKDIGITYRIGGDEFCVLCKQVSESRLKEAFNLLESLSAKQFTSDSNPILIAYGYEIYKKTDTRNINESFAKADRAMYVHKMILKNQSLVDQIDII
jgi:diguanylate cyclase (GGDEF)-like protein